MVTTPNRLYPLQATGANVGTWGTVLNNQVFGVIDLNLGGRYNVDVSGNTDITLTSTNTENIYHHLTGILTGNINYIFPAGEGGDFIVFNNTSGAFTVTVKISGGTGLLVTQGAALRIFIDPDAGAAVSGGSVAIVSGGGLEYSNNALQRSALTGDVTASAGSNATTIAANAVTTVAIAANAVTLAKLATQADSTVLANISGSSAVPTAASLASAIAYGNGLLYNTEAQGPATGGVNITEKDLGNLSGNTVTPNPGNRGIQKLTNNGSGTILPGSAYGTYLLALLNTTGAAVPTTSSWTKVTGDSFDTTTTSQFLCHCTVIPEFSVMIVLKVA